MRRVRQSEARRSRRAGSRLVVVAGVAAAPGARATVYKCADADGAIVYQEAPCPKGKELRNFDTDPPEISVVPAYTGRSRHRPAADKAGA